MSLKTTIPTDQTLLTLLTETEFMINSRPLTYVPLDHDDDLPLTPNDFLFMKTDSHDYPFGVFTDYDLLRRTWRESQRLADLTWKRWVKEYLPTLNRRDKWYRDNDRPLIVGDLVVIADDQLPRNQWPLGRVDQVFPGKDGLIRVAQGKTRHGLYVRPVTKLCRLGVRSST
ncbi:uncharacterized protein LOC132902874 [Amyelois transitella]|uniref:uncharacterized protein LOC132902874 n=1 Tax=Amyelois transitella TaxID=680683 RepID=UPI00298FD2B9|nr:uncharacterized protein LOC132902874 [Amyelois transitella]